VERTQANRERNTVNHILQVVISSIPTFLQNAVIAAWRHDVRHGRLREILRAGPAGLPARSGARRASVIRSHLHDREYGQVQEYSMRMVGLILGHGKESSDCGDVVGVEPVERTTQF
jgi:hypothetical protein